MGTERGPPLCISTHPDTKHPAPSHPTKSARTSVNDPSSSRRRLRVCRGKTQHGQLTQHAAGLIAAGQTGWLGDKLKNSSKPLVIYKGLSHLQCNQQDVGGRSPC